MRRKYGDCQRADGDCTACSLANYGMDCKNKVITNLEWQRRMARLSIKELAEASGVNSRQIQRIENGEGDMSNVTLGNAVKLADALGVDVKELL